MEYLKSRAHIQALLIEEGIPDRQHEVSSPTVYLANAESVANDMYKASIGCSAKNAANILHTAIERHREQQANWQAEIQKLQTRIDAYERVILRLCPPPPPPTPEEELAILRDKLLRLADTEGVKDTGIADELIALAVPS